MPQPRKKAAVVAPEAPVEPVAEPPKPVAEPPKPVAEPPKPVGYLPRPRWIRATADWQDDRDDSEKLSAEINVAGLTVSNTAWLWEKGLKYDEVWDFLADRVRDWNAMAYDRESRSYTVAPAPADVGWKAFALVDSNMTIEVMLLVAKALRGGDARPDFLSSSASPPANADAKNSA